MKKIFLMTIVFLLFISCSSIEEVISTNLNNDKSESAEEENNLEVDKSDTKKNVPSSKPLPKISSKSESTSKSITNPTQTPIPYKESKSTESKKIVTNPIPKLPPTTTPKISATKIPTLVTQVPEETKLKFPLDDLTLVNLSDYDDQEILILEQLISEKINHTDKTKTISLIYPVGEIILPEREASGTPFMAHEVSLNEDQIIFILSNLRSWLQINSSQCSNSIEIGNIVSDTETWIRSGADPSSMSFVCKDLRIVTIAIPSGSGLANEKREFQNTYLHERYNSEQKDIEECSINGEFRFSNSIWFNEGAAHYFSTTLLAEMEGKDPYSEILRMALIASKEGGDIVIGQPDKWGAAALLLMTKLNELSEESIMNASLFNNCAKENEFDKDSILIKHVKKSWYSIEENNNVFTFSEKALSK
ncbi:MAG: hypothetical protein P8K05_01855 [Dehalococcoidia bacterium]|nr:hypothetical protein [Dehalococcoidia bacterium]